LSRLGLAGVLVQMPDADVGVRIEDAVFALLVLCLRVAVVDVKRRVFFFREMGHLYPGDQFSLEGLKFMQELGGAVICGKMSP